MSKKKPTAKKVSCTKQQDVPLRVAMLNKGAELTNGDRDKTYGDPTKNMRHFAGLLNAHFKEHLVVEFNAEDAAAIMVFAKLSRTKANLSSPYHADNYIDAATYVAIQGECAFKERDC